MTKAKVFADIRAAIAGGKRMPKNAPLNQVPLNTQTSRDICGLFKSEAQRVQMQIIEAQRSQIQSIVEAYWVEHGLSGALLVSDEIEDLPWTIPIRRGDSDGRQLAAVTLAFAAIAETATLVVTSKSHPVAFNFLPDHHFIVLNKSQLVERIDALWPLLRAYVLDASAVNLITGPSRTGDIEQTIEIGAHGPRAVIVILLD